MDGKLNVDSKNKKEKLEIKKYQEFYILEFLRVK